MKFEATEQQIREIAVKAITYSKPLGLGFLETLGEIDIKPENIKLDEYGLALDYVKGRCVKLFIRRGLPEGSCNWHIDNIADPEYQTWARRYVSNETLVSSVLEDGKINIAGKTIDDYAGEAILDRYVDPSVSRQSGELQPGETGTKPKYPNFKDVKRMSENLANLLRMLVEIVQNHGDRIKLLEEGESAEDSDDADLMEEVTSLLAKLQNPESAEPVPSDQM